MQIFRPIQSNRVGQKFGANEPCVKVGQDGQPIKPYQFGGYVNSETCMPGYTKLYPTLGLKGHNGIDMGCWHGEPLYHGGDWSGWMIAYGDEGGGVGVDIISDLPLVDGKHVKLRYYHLKSFVGWTGKKVRPGELIGYGDNTGISSGDHLHYAAKLCDKDGNTLDKDNGYWGAVDPEPYFVNEFIVEFVNVRKEALSAIQLATKVIYDTRQLLKRMFNR